MISVYMYMYGCGRQGWYLYRCTCMGVVGRDDICIHVHV